MNKIKAKVAGISTGLGIALAGFSQFAHAQFSSTTAVTVSNNLVADVGYIIGATITAIMALYVALTGLGWAVRKFKQKVTGRKF